MDSPYATPWFDRLGGLASAACAVHCVLVSALPAILPLAGLGWLGGETTDWALVATAVLLALLAGLQGYRRHRSRGTLVAFVGGLTLIIAGHLIEAGDAGHRWSLMLLLSGAATLVTAHVRNLRRSRACRENTCMRRSTST